MPSSLTWIAHDRDEHDRVNRILAALKQSEARDEMGLGAVRDSLADQLFPGTSTIQTRIRYFLIVPWCFQHIEAKYIRYPKFGSQVERLERDLIAPLLAHDDVAGTFGRVTGRDVKRLPSSVYWAGLATWGIRKLDLSQQRYTRQIDQVYQRQKLQRRNDDGELIRDSSAIMWDPDLPPPPQGFPDKLSLNLEKREAEYLRDRIQTAAPHSMLAILARAPQLAGLEHTPFPWNYPGVEGFSETVQEVLHHAQIMSELMWGAALLYNWQLAGLAAPEASQDRLQAIRDDRSADLQRWRAKTLQAGGLKRLQDWDFRRFQQVCGQPGHNISDRTWAFIQGWRQCVVDCEGLVENDIAAQELVYKRELFMKRSGGRSRFKNESLRAIWNGTAGIGRMGFRWPGAHELLNDIHAGLGRV